MLSIKKVRKLGDIDEWKRHSSQVLLKGTHVAEYFTRVSKDT